MASSSPPPSPPPPQKTKKEEKKGRKPKGSSASDLAQVDSLSWAESLSAADDPFSLLAGSAEGGFLSLEEIDESEYGFIGGAAPEPRPKKRKRGEEGGDGVGAHAKGGEEKKGRKKHKKKNGRKKEKKEGGIVKVEVEGLAPVDTSPPSGDASKNMHVGRDDVLLLKEDEIYAWTELRLHPLLMKAIRRLGFTEPTPVQKACIPCAAHQGKDVVGAAETGSGKTLAYGLPILQRLLEEREKDSRSHQQEAKLVLEKGSKGGPLRSLIVTPTRELALQVSDHLKEAARYTNIGIVPIVGGMSTEKQERLLKRRPEIVVGTPGRLWELMSTGDEHLAELHSLSFFVLDEADRMIENGHFHELQSIIDMLPMASGSAELCSQATQVCKTVPSLQQKKRQTFVFSATIALSDSFRKKLKRGLSSTKPFTTDGLSSIEKLSQRAGMRADAAIVDLTNASIVADKLEESFIECSEEDKEAYLYYILSVHGYGRTIIFCTSIAALRRISSLLRILGINAWTLHAQMQQRARLKAIDRFRGNDHGVLIATDVAARGLDIPGIRTVVHYQLPHSAEVYIHRSGRTARASADGCCIALISPGDKAKFFSLCKSLSKRAKLYGMNRAKCAEHIDGKYLLGSFGSPEDSLQYFPLNDAYMPEVMNRLFLARQIDKILRKNSKENAKKSWFERNAQSMELATEDSGSEEETVKNHKQKKISCFQLKKLQQELNGRLTQPLQPKTLSSRFLAGAGISPLLQKQFEELVKKKMSGKSENTREELVIGQDRVEPLQALRSSGHEVCVRADKRRETQKLAETWKRKKREEKKREREQRRKERKKAKERVN